MNLIIDFDDFHWDHSVNCLDSLYTIISEVQQAKITLFTVPFYKFQTIGENKEWCNQVRELVYSGNLELGVHGFEHTPVEFKFKNKDRAKRDIIKAETHFRCAQLPFAKVFKGPQWGINSETYEALEELNYTHIYSHEEYKYLVKPTQKIKTVYYNWNLKDLEPPKEDLIIAHGHTHNVCDNGIDQVKDKLINFLKHNNITYRFGSEV